MGSVILKPLVFVSLLMTLFISQGSFAAIDTYEFSNEDLRTRFYQLSEELRCPKCQNQNLADSDAPIATDLRAVIYKLLNEGKTDDQIKTYLVDRYGEYILYRPQWSQQTWLLWLAPIILLVAGLMVVLILVKRSQSGQQKVGGAGQAPLSEEDKMRVQQLLNQANKSKEDN